MKLFEQSIRLTTIGGGSATIADWRDHVLLIVNVASRCGYTPQYAGLEALYRRYKDRGFVVLAFPSDQFGHQEPGDEASIRQFCSETYDITFPMFGKIDVNGPAAHPLFEILKREQRGPFGSKRILWNFTKFLIARDGTVLARYSTRTSPADLERDVVRALALDAPAP